MALYDQTISGRCDLRTKAGDHIPRGQIIVAFPGVNDPGDALM